MNRAISDLVLSVITKLNRTAARLAEDEGETGSGEGPRASRGGRLRTAPRPVAHGTVEPGWPPPASTLCTWVAGHLNRWRVAP